MLAQPTIEAKLLHFIVAQGPAAPLYIREPGKQHRQSLHISKSDGSSPHPHFLHFLQQASVFHELQHNADAVNNVVQLLQTRTNRDNVN
jgi:hypothetical protein